MPYLKSQEFYNNLKSKNFDPVYIFVGEEAYLQAEALKHIYKALSMNDLNYEIFYGQQSPADNILLATQTMPFLSEKRLIVIKDAQKIKTQDLNKLSEYLKSPVSFSCLVLLWQDKLRQENKKSQLFTAAEQSGSIVDFRSLYERELPQWIEQKVKASGKRIAFDAVQYLIQESGTNLMDIANEIDKLSLFVGDNSEIILKDIEALSGHTKQLNLNQLGESIEARNFENSLLIIENLLNEGEIPLKILSTIYRTFRKLLTAKAMQDENNLSPQQIRLELKIHPYFFNKFLSNLSNFSINELKNSMSFALEADRLLKSSSKPHSMIFEELLFSTITTKSR